MTGEVYEARALVEDLPDPPQAPRRAANPPDAHAGGDDPLRAVSPPAYVEALTGAEVGRDGKVPCPFHSPDRTPSLHVYDDPEQGWFCFGACGCGGDIFTFAGRLWGLDPRGSDFREIRRRLEAELVPALRRAA
jgi:hypothetical protein